MNAFSGLILVVLASFMPFGRGMQTDGLEVPLMTCLECQREGLENSMQVINVLEMVSKSSFTGYNGLKYILDLSSPLLVSLSDSGFCETFTSPLTLEDMSLSSILQVESSKDEQECHLIEKNYLEEEFFDTFGQEEVSNANFDLYSAPDSFELIYSFYEDLEEECFYLSPQLNSSYLNEWAADVDGIFGFADIYAEEWTNASGDLMTGDPGTLSSLLSMIGVDQMATVNMVTRTSNNFNGSSVFFGNKDLSKYFLNDSAVATFAQDSNYTSPGPYLPVNEVIFKSKDNQTTWSAFGTDGIDQPKIYFSIADVGLYPPTQSIVDTLLNEDSFEITFVLEKDLNSLQLSLSFTSELLVSEESGKKLIDTANKTISGRQVTDNDWVFGAIPLSNFALTIDYKNHQVSIGESKAKTTGGSPIWKFMLGGSLVFTLLMAILTTIGALMKLNRERKEKKEENRPEEAQYQRL